MSGRGFWLGVAVGLAISLAAYALVLFVVLA